MSGDAGLGGFSAQAVAIHQALELLGFIAVDKPDFAAERLQTCFEQQRDHQHDGWRLGMPSEPVVKTLPHDRVNQLLEPEAFCFVVENDLAQGSSVDTAPLA